MTEENINRRIKNAMLTKPFPYQWEGIRFIESTNGRCFLFMDRGTGKTLVSLGYTAIHPELQPAIIVCPASLKINWRKEAKKHIGKPSQILSGKTPHTLTPEGIYIINYDIVTSWQQELLEIEPKLIIFDEFQALKSLETQRTRSCKQLSMNTPKVIGLTGTPITSRPSEFFSLAHIVIPELFPNWFSYIYRYCDAKKRYGRLDYSGASNLGQLHQKIKPHMFRVRKKDVLSDLPEKTIQVVPIEITNRKEYNKAYADFLQLILDSKKNPKLQMQILAEYGRIMQLITQGKLSDIHDWVDTFLEGEGKLILFMTHTAPLREIYNKHKKYAVLIDGKIPMNKRDEAVERFQNDPKVRLFCGNILAAGTGLTLTAADTVVFGELSDVPADHLQAVDRAVRIGQKNNVNVYYLVADNTLEERKCEMLHEKMKIIDEAIDGKESEAIDLDLKTELFKALSKK